MTGAAGVLVTGTGTGVGKTYFSALLAGRLRELGVEVGVMKPVETGVPGREDGVAPTDHAVLREASGADDPLEMVCPYRFPEPTAPSIAARLAGRTIDLERIEAAFASLCRRRSFVIVEGAGGVAVPLGQGIDFRDVALRLGVPAILVSSRRLGFINEIRLSAEALARAGVPLLGLVWNGPAVQDHTLEEAAMHEVLASVSVPAWLLLPQAGAPGARDSAVEAGLTRIAGVVLEAAGIRIPRTTCGSCPRS